jgi:hypothetical protein
MEFAPLIGVVEGAGEYKGKKSSERGEEESVKV